MIKKSVLFFLCFTLFLSIPGCKKKLPTTPDIPAVLKPTIEYFYADPASIKLGNSTTLHWSIKDATNVMIDQGIGAVSPQGEQSVTPGVTTTYTLTAINSDGQISKSCTIEIKQWAILEFSTNPETPMFYYDSTGDFSYSDFTFNMTETAGVGGQINNFDAEVPYPYFVDHGCSNHEFGGGTFGPFGTLSRYCSFIIPCQPTVILFYILGTDANDYLIQETVYFTVTWTQNMGVMRFLKIVEGQSHHKLIK